MKTSIFFVILTLLYSSAAFAQVKYNVRNYTYGNVTIQEFKEVEPQKQNNSVATPQGILKYPFDVQIDGLWYSLINDNTATVSKNEGTDLETVIIKPQITYNLKTYTVKKIELGAFQNCVKINSVDIPGTVTTIGGSAFKGCLSLREVHIPSSVVSMGTKVFEGTPWIDSFIKDNNHIFNNLVYINNVVYDVTSHDITSITFRDGTKGIAYGAFDYCEKLTSVHIPASITNIYVGAFRGCTGICELSVDKDNTAYRSEGNAIIRRSNNSLIVGCKNTVIPPSVKDIGSFSFYDCSTLQSITIPESVKQIGQYSFKGCTALTEVIIPKSVKKIKKGAFQDCTRLKSLTLPQELKKNYKSFTSGCPMLQNITVLNNE